jgi:hypothetical protein
MSKNLLKMWGSGLLKIGDIEIDAYVLEDGTPLIGKTKILKALGRPKKGDKSEREMPAFLDAKNLLPFIRPELTEKLKGVEFKNGTRNISAYHADILADICSVYLDARQAGALLPTQLPVAQRCEIMLRSFAKIGIRALIYEQLGFEKMKHPEAFRMLVESYLDEEIRKWSKEFPDEFFFQLDRIYKNQPSVNGRRPQYYAKFIRKYVYEPLLKGAVLKKLDERNPVTEKGYRKHKHHTLTSETVGLPAVKSQLWQVIAALKISSNKRLFESNYARMMGNTVQLDAFEDVDG